MSQEGLDRRMEFTLLRGLFFLAGGLAAPDVGGTLKNVPVIARDRSGEIVRKAVSSNRMSFG